METIFGVIFLFVVSASVWANVLMFSMLKKVHSILLDMEIKHAEIDSKYDNMLFDLQKAVSDVSTNISEITFTVHKNLEEKANKNNWESIRGAFNRPSRVELNERVQ